MVRQMDNIANTELQNVYLHDKLMCSGHESESIAVIEGFGDVLPEGVAGTSRRYTPASSVIGVWPQ